MAGGGAPISDELTPYPPKDQLPNVSYCITSPPPWPEAILLGFQHYLLMLGTAVIIPTVLVPQMGGGNRFRKIVRATQGALIVGSTIQIVLGFSGLWCNVARFLSPSAVPLVSLVGFGLSEFGFPGVAKCIEIGLPQLILLVVFSQYLVHLVKAGKNIFDHFAILFTVVIVWIYAHRLTMGGAYNGTPHKTQVSSRTDRSGLIGAAPWIRVPYPFQWGAPSLDEAR